jgi:hypothetical protein
VTTAAASETHQPQAHRSYELVKLRLVKLGLVAATVFAMLSLGGLMMFAFPVLVLGHLWAFRRARIAERSLWFVLAVASAAEWAWEITYPSTGGPGPWSWIVLTVTVAMTSSVFAIVGRRARPSAS